MSGSAHVRSVEAVVAFTSALRQFEERAAGSLLSLDQEIGRGVHWLEHEAPALWRQRIRDGFEEVARTRAALHTCRMRTVGGNRPACIEEEQAHLLAKRRLERAHEKLELVRRWNIRIHRDLDEYRGRIGRLRRHLEGDVPKLVGLLERIENSLAGYLDRPLDDPEAEPRSGAESTDEDR